MNHRFARPWALVPAAAVVAAVLVVGGAAAARNPRATLVGSVPPWAASSNFKSAASGSDTVGFRVYLGWRNDAQAEARAQAVSDPSSSSYGKFLSPAQFRQQFAPSQSDVNAVQSWLKSQGFTVDYTPANNHYVAAEGTVAQAEAAFGAQLNEYSYDGLTLRAPASELSVPASLAGTAEAVVGLDQSSALVHPDHIAGDTVSAGFRNAPPCSAYWGEKLDTTDGTFPDAPCGYQPAQIQGAYGIAGAIKSGQDGSGSTVAIIDAYASPTIQSDANTYSGKYGLPKLTGSNFQQVVAPGTYHHPESLAQDPAGWYGEETLDVEAVHTTAPGAKIVFVGAPNNYSDLDAALNHVVDRGLAQVVTNSYGFSGESLPKGYIKPFEDTLVQAAAEGISVTFSSGDSGDESGGGVGTPAADWPASSPWVTAVGGTSLAVGANDDYLFETGWSTAKSTLGKNGKWSAPAYQYGGGGGISRLFAEPPYQTGTVDFSKLDTSAFGVTSGRVVPDVSMLADPNTGFLVGQTQAFPDGNYYDEYRIGGTSLASPLFAGMLALVNQARGEAGMAQIGFANPALYAAGSSAYRDIVPASGLGVVRVDYVDGVDDAAGTTKSLRWLDDENTFIHSAPGYDDMTGLGTPNGTSFVAALAK